MPMTLKARLAQEGRRLSGELSVIPSPVVTQAIAAAGVDCVILDLEHGPASHETLHAMIAATAGTGCAPLVRIPEISEPMVKRVLDLGAEGVCFPLIRGVADAERCVAALRYRPEGRRNWGPFLAHSRWQVPILDYATGPGRDTVCMILIETVEALEDIDAICAVEGIDCIVLATFDLSTELGVSGQFDHPKMTAAVARIEAAVLGAGIPLGGASFGAEQTAGLIARGYRLVFGVDLLRLKAGVGQAIGWIDEAP